MKAAAHRARHAALAVLAPVLLAACAAPDRTDGAAAMCALSRSDQQLQLRVGSTCELRLASNRTTGYAWRLLPVEPELVTQLGATSHEPVPTAAPLVGAGGHDLFRLQALQPGRVTLRWIYQRPWLPADAAPADHHELQVTVLR